MLKLLWTLFAFSLALPAEAAHPTLPTMWIATTKEPVAPGDGVGIEAYNFVAKPTKEDPSAIWSNYTDCQRLIYDEGGGDGGPGQRRYLFKCDAVDCCYESQQGNQVEFQIPNVRFFGKEATVTAAGKQTINVLGDSVTADTWQWTFGKFAKYTAWTTGSGTNITLHKWFTGVDSANVTSSILFKDYRAIPADQAATFKATFARPPESKCRISCPSLRAAGKLRSYQDAWGHLAL